jgi:hypothetical protein
MLNQPFFQVALPIMVTFVAAIWGASWSQNKRLDEMGERLDDIVARIGRIEDRLVSIEARLGAVEVKAWR